MAIQLLKNEDQTMNTFKSGCQDTYFNLVDHHTSGAQYIIIIIRKTRYLIQSLSLLLLLFITSMLQTKKTSTVELKDLVKKAIARNTTVLLIIDTSISLNRGSQKISNGLYFSFYPHSLYFHLSKE